MLFQDPHCHSFNIVLEIWVPFDCPGVAVERLPLFVTQQLGNVIHFRVHVFPIVLDEEVVHNYKLVNLITNFSNCIGEISSLIAGHQ